MVKANGYGLGAVEVAGALTRLEPYALGVATPGEGIELRDAGIEERIIVFAPGVIGEAEALLAGRLDISVFSLSSLRALDSRVRENGGSVGIHLEIDTGMGRAGFIASAAEEWVPQVAKIIERGGVCVESAFTHFHSAAEDGAVTAFQFKQFEASLTLLESAGVTVPLRHASNSDAILHDRQYHLDLVRPGIYMYGGRRGTGINGPLPDPKVVASVRARILEVRSLAAGATLSYGAKYVTRREESIATLGIGYADGIPWRPGSQGHAIVRGTRVPIRGSVCMDMTLLDVSAVSSVEPWSVVTLLGSEGDEEITLADLAEIGQTIEYEILTGFSQRVPRYYSPYLGACHLYTSDAADE